VLERHSVWLFVNTSKGVYIPEKPTVLAGQVSKIHGHEAFQITHIHGTVINSGRATLLNTVGLCCGASVLTVTIILADAAVTTPSPKWPATCRVGR